MMQSISIYENGAPRYYISSDLSGVYEHRTYQQVGYFEGGTLFMLDGKPALALSADPEDTFLHPVDGSTARFYLDPFHTGEIRALREGKHEEEIEFGSSAVDVAQLVAVRGHRAVLGPGYWDRSVKYPPIQWPRCNHGSRKF